MRLRQSRFPMRCKEATKILHLLNLWTFKRRTALFYRGYFATVAVVWKTIRNSNCRLWVRIIIFSFSNQNGVSRLLFGVVFHAFIISISSLAPHNSYSLIRDTQTAFGVKVDASKPLSFHLEKCSNLVKSIRKEDFEKHVFKKRENWHFITLPISSRRPTVRLNKKFLVTQKLHRRSQQAFKTYLRNWTVTEKLLWAVASVCNFFRNTALWGGRCPPTISLNSSSSGWIQWKTTDIGLHWLPNYNSWGISARCCIVNFYLPHAHL